jgi:hypothetical protein
MSTAEQVQSPRKQGAEEGSSGDFGPRTSSELPAVQNTRAELNTVLIEAGDEITSRSSGPKALPPPALGLPGLDQSFALHMASSRDELPDIPTLHGALEAVNGQLELLQAKPNQAPAPNLVIAATWLEGRCVRALEEIRNRLDATSELQDLHHQPWFGAAVELCFRLHAVEAPKSSHMVALRGGLMHASSSEEAFSQVAGALLGNRDICSGRFADTLLKLNESRASVTRSATPEDGSQEAGQEVAKVSKWLHGPITNSIVLVPPASGTELAFSAGNNALVDAMRAVEARIFGTTLAEGPKLHAAYHSEWEIGNLIQSLRERFELEERGITVDGGISKLHHIRGEIKGRKFEAVMFPAASLPFAMACVDGRSVSNGDALVEALGLESVYRQMYRDGE